MSNLYAAFKALPRINPSLLLATLLLLATTAIADNRLHMVPISLEERASKANLIVEGEVVSQRSFWNEEHTNIYTSNIIKVYKVFKGEVQQEQLELITQGGTVGLKKHVLTSSLALYKGQQGVFFLMQQNEVRNSPARQALSTRAYAAQQGFVKYDMQAGSAADVFNTYSTIANLYGQVTKQTRQDARVVQENITLRDALNAAQTDTKTQRTQLIPVITNLSPQVTTAGTGAVLTITGTNFGSTRGIGKVEFRNSDDGGRSFTAARARDYVSWSNTRIQVRVPSQGQDGGTAGTGQVRVTASDGTTTLSATPLTIEYAYSNVVLAEGNIRSFQPMLQNKNGDGGYTIRFAPSLQNRSAAQEGFRRAVNSWVCTTNVNWEVGEPTSIEASNDDDVSVIRFAPNSFFGQEGVLASTLSRYEGYRCGPAATADTLFWLSEFDMAINNTISWQYGPGGPADGQFDFETVMLHELGHAHQLGHVILPRAVMHYAVEEQALIRDLSDADINGGNFILEKSVVSNLCDIPPMERKTDGDCNLAPEIYTFEALFQNNQVQLNWQTQQELTVDYFVIQRSANGSDWEDLAEVNANGPSANRLSYSYIDTAPLPDVTFYRLRLVYNDNSFGFSPRVRVINPRSLRVLRVYPNPVAPTEHRVNLLYLVQANTDISIQLYNSSGKKVRDLTVPLTDTNTPIELSMSNLAAGIYILKWQEKSNSGEFKILRL